MIQVSNESTQVLQPGQFLKFDKPNPFHTGCGECFNSQIPTSVKLKSGCGGVYELQFSGNITASADNSEVQIAIAAAGQPLVETAMNAQITTANALFNVGSGTFFKVCCSDFDRIGIMNTGTVPVTIAQNANLRICRKA